MANEILEQLNIEDTNENVSSIEQPVVEEVVQPQFESTELTSENLGLDVEQTFEPEKTEVEASSEDIWNIANPLAISFNNEEVNLGVGEYYDENFKISNFIESNTDYWNSLTPIEQDKAFNATSEQHLYSVVKKNKIFNESLERFQQDDSTSKYLEMLVAGALDPTFVLPAVGATNKLNTVLNLKSVMAKALGTGTVWAGVNVASESLFDIQDLETDYMNSAMFGFALGGGFGGMSALMKNAKDPDTIASNFLDRNDDVLNRVDIDENLDLKIQEDGVTVAKYKKDPIEEEEVGILSIKTVFSPSLSEKFDGLYSPINNLWEKGIKTTSDFMKKTIAPSVSVRSSNGTTVPVQNTAFDYIETTFKPIQNTFNNNVNKTYKLYKDNGYEGTFVDLQKEATVEYRKIINQQDELINVEFETLSKELRNSKKISKDTDIENKVIENVTKKVENKVAKDLREGKISEDKVESLRNKMFEKEIKNKKNIDSAKKEVEKEIEKELTNIKNDLYKKHNIESLVENNQYKQIILDFKKFQNDMLIEGKRLDIDEFKNINVNKGHVPRLWDFQKISKMGDVDVKRIVTRMYDSSSANKNKSAIQRKKDIDDFTSALIKQASKTEESMVRRFDNNFKDTANNFLKNRTITLNDSVGDDLITDSMLEMVNSQSYKSQGDYALRKAFPEFDGNKEKILKAFDESLEQEFKNGVINRKQKESYNRQYELILSELDGSNALRANLKDPSWQKFARVAEGFNAVTLLGGAGINSLNEVVSAMSTTASKSFVIRHIGKSIKESLSVLKGSEGTARQREMVEEFGIFGNMLDNTRVQKFADTEAGFNQGVVEEKINGAVNNLMLYNGMKLIQNVLETGIVASTTNDIFKFGKKLLDGKTLSKKERQIADFVGLKDKDIIDLHNILKEKAKFKQGLFGEYIDYTNIKNWNDIDLINKMKTAVTRNKNFGVTQGDTMQIPAYMLERKPIVKFLASFMKIPIATSNTLLKKGLTEDRVGLFINSAMAISVFAGVTYLREQSMIAVGLKDENKAKYDLFNDDGAMGKLFWKSMNYNAFAGHWTTIYQYVMIVAGQPELGRDYAQDITNIFGVSVSRLGDIPKLMKKFIDGEPLDSQSLYILKSFIPFMTLPIINEGFNKAIKEIQ